MDKLLLHSCCAPCSVYCVDTLRADGIEPTSLWFNPNIHPGRSMTLAAARCYEVTGEKSM